ncbi:ankyrin, partial [Choiromyces venosus 120613-1]
EDRSGVTPLHIAAESGQGEATKLFIADPRTDINSLSDVGNTPLHLAIWSGRTEVVASLLADPRTQINITNILGWTPFRVAIEQKENEIAASLFSRDPRIDFNHKAYNGRTALHYTAQRGHLDMTKFLLSDPRADPSLRDSLGYTPLHLSFIYGEDSVAWLLMNLT